MPAEWVLCIVVPIIRNYSCNRAVKLLEHDMKVVEKELQKRTCRSVC